MTNSRQLVGEVADLRPHDTLGSRHTTRANGNDRRHERRGVGCHHAWDAALVVSAFDTWLAIENIQAVVGTERGPALGLDPLPAGSQDRGDRRAQIVVADLARRYPGVFRAWTCPSKNAS